MRKRRRKAELFEHIRPEYEHGGRIKVTPLAVITLPKPFERIYLGLQGDASKSYNGQKLLHLSGSRPRSTQYP